MEYEFQDAYGQKCLKAIILVQQKKRSSARAFLSVVFKFCCTFLVNNVFQQVDLPSLCLNLKCLVLFTTVVLWFYPSFSPAYNHSFLHSSISLLRSFVHSFVSSFFIIFVILLTFVSYFTQPGPNSTSENLQCFCNHLTSFGGELLPTPADIDFEEVFIGFASLGKTGNVGVIVAVGVFFLLYIVGVVFARKADRRDEEQVRFLLCQFPHLGTPILGSWPVFWAPFIPRRKNLKTLFSLMQCVNEPEQTICYRKKKTNLSSSCIYPVIDFEFRHNIVKVGVRFSCKSLTLE